MADLDRAQEGLRAAIHRLFLAGQNESPVLDEVLADLWATHPSSMMALGAKLKPKGSLYGAPLEERSETYAGGEGVLRFKIRRSSSIRTPPGGSVDPSPSATVQV